MTVRENDWPIGLQNLSNFFNRKKNYFQIFGGLLYIDSNTEAAIGGVL